MAWTTTISNLLKKAKAVASGKPVAEALPEMLPEGDPRTLIRPLGGDWLCPFTLQRVAAPSWDGSPATLLKCAEVVNYLLLTADLGKLSSSTPMKDFADLAQTTVFLRMQSAPNHKVCNPSGEWICPYCLQNSGLLLINWDGSETPFATFYPDALRHFSQCPAQQSDPLGAKPLDAVKEASGPLPQVRKLVATDSRFRLSDSSGAWLCPYTERVVPTINLKRENWETAQAKVVQYLMSEACPGRFNQWAVAKSEAELRAGLR